MLLLDGSKNSYLGVNILMDDTYKVITRKVSTIMGAVGATGGFMTVTFMIIMIFV